MSTTVGRNSLIMACGTAASRVTGQIRTIFLVGALGTTGIAANAYQAGAQIPQVIFNLLSTGIFNAVLVPQIVRTLKEDDAEDRLNKLITLSGALLLVITLVMMSGTPLLTALYLDSSWDPAQRALANAFTLWCMPQILFYGLYTVLGQILAAKGRFATYAWSSVGANVISCIGFGTFIVLFGNAGRQPMGFWTADKVALTAGAWTAGVAFQALVLFIPLFRMGLHYRPRWGVRGLGLRSMGQVAVWSMAMVVLNQLMGIINSRVNTGAPTAGGDLYGIAGNASYQYAYTIYILPYSIIAVSITTAVFPRLSRAISEQRIDDARADLSSSLRTTGLAMIFFTAAMIAMPVPLVKALIPSATLHGAMLISGPLIGLLVGLVPTSAFLLVQRAFYAYEDGKSPFLFSAVDNAVQLTLLLIALHFTQPKDWVLMVALSLSLSYLLTFPWVFWLLRRRFGGHLDGRRIVTMHVKALFAGGCAGVCGWLLNPIVTRILGASVIRADADGDKGYMNWGQAIIICAVLTIVVAVVYAALLWILRVNEFTDLIHTVMRRIHRNGVARSSTSNDGSSSDARNSSNTNTDATDRSSAATSGNADIEIDAPSALININDADQYARVDNLHAESSADVPSGVVKPTNTVLYSEIGNETDNAMSSAVDSALGSAVGSAVNSTLGSAVGSAVGSASSTISSVIPSDTSAHSQVSNTPNMQTQPDISSATPTTPTPATPQSAPPIMQSTTQPVTQHNEAGMLTTSPTDRMSATSQVIHHKPAQHDNKGIMKPQLGDTVVGRYTLVSPLREETGLSAWIVTDRMLAQDCQMFIINDESILPQVNSAASALVLANSRYCTRVLQLQHVDSVALVITEEDAGLSLTEYLTSESGKFLSFEAIRSILCQSTEAVQELLDTNPLHTALSTDTIRIGVDGIQLADTPVVSALVDVCETNRTEDTPYEQHAIRQLSAVLYSLLTHTPSDPNMSYSLANLPADTPPEFRVICRRGLGLQDPAANSDSSNSDGEHMQNVIPMVSLAEFSALLGAWIPFDKLQEHDIALPTVASTASISTARMRDLSKDTIVDLPENFAISQKLPDLAISAAGRTAGAEARFESEQRRLKDAFIEQLPGDIPSELPVIDRFEQPLPEPDTAAPSSTLAALQSKVGHIVSFWHKDGSPVEDTAEPTMFEVADDALPVSAPPVQPVSFPPAQVPRRRASENAPAAASNAPLSTPSGSETMLIPTGAGNLSNTTTTSAPDNLSNSVPNNDYGTENVDDVSGFTGANSTENASTTRESGNVSSDAYDVYNTDSREPYAQESEVAAQSTTNMDDPVRAHFDMVTAGNTGELPTMPISNPVPVGAAMPVRIPPAQTPVRGSANNRNVNRAETAHSSAALEALAAHTDEATNAAEYDPNIVNGESVNSPVMNGSTMPVSFAPSNTSHAHMHSSAMNGTITEGTAGQHIVGTNGANSDDSTAGVAGVSQESVRVPVSRSRMTVPIQRTTINDMAAASGEVAADATTSIPLLGMDGTPIEPLPPTMPPSFAPTQVHQHNTQIDIDSELPDKPLWKSLPVRITVIIVALAVLIGLFVLAFFSLSSKSDNGNSLHDEQYNKSDLENVPFGDSNGSTSGAKSQSSAATDSVTSIAITDIAGSVDRNNFTWLLL